MLKTTCKPAPMRGAGRCGWERKGLGRRQSWFSRCFRHLITSKYEVLVAGELPRALRVYPAGRTLPEPAQSARPATGGRYDFRSVAEPGARDEFRKDRA